MEINVGVTNPYAIAELVAGKQIRWSSLDDPQKTLSSILQIPAEKIFAADSPILRPGVTTDASGKQKILPPEEAQKRLDSYLKSNLREVPGSNPLPLNVLTPARAKLLTEILIHPQPNTNNQPWEPANTAWVDKGDFFEDLDEINDPIQGISADCKAALAGS